MPSSVPPKPTPRIEAIRRRIVRVDWICAGTLLERTKVCGKPTCRCASDPTARHGPYYEWNRLRPEGLRHRVVSAEDARQIRRAQESYQLILGCLEQWEEESARVLLGPPRAPRRSGRR
jgi:hypothetical protein